MKIKFVTYLEVSNFEAMSTTKEAIILLGDQLIRKRGYNAFSYADISKELQVKNAAIHYHFPNKSDLGMAIIDYHLDNLNRFINTTESIGPFQKILAFLGIYEDVKLEQKVCLVGAIATDWDTVEDKIRVKMQLFADILLNWLTLSLEQGLSQKVFVFTGPARTKALMIISNMLAATQLARITGDANFETIRAEVLRGLKG